MFAFAVAERDTGVLILGRDRLGIKPLYLAETAGPAAVRRALPALLAGGDVDTSIDRVALHHYMTFHSVVPAPRTILAGRPQAAAGHRPHDRARRHAATEHVYWRPEHVRRDAGRRHDRARLARRRARVAADRGASAGWSPTCRSGCCSPAASTRR